jgi:Na+-translocating ferredoxin:NAD+ oxidoreductase subunit B
MTINESVYEMLAQALDDLPGGFPHSENGVELRILRKLYTPEEAEIARHLTLIAEEPRVIARRAGLPVAEATRLLEEMDRKRLIYYFPEGGKPARYMAQQFLIGIYESQVNRLDRELVEEFEQYLPVYNAAGLWGKVPQLRTIPIQQSITNEAHVLPYEAIDEIMRSHTRFGVANCICRQEQRLLDHDCGKPLETCMITDSTVDYFVRVGRGREISREEAQALLEQAERTGLVLQVGNDQSAGGICMCCGCCCGVLRMLKTHPQPASQASSPFQARLNEELCMGCEVCISRCQMDALTFSDFHAVLDLNRCIGCGLCVTTCVSGALTLERKAKTPPVPKNIVNLFFRMAHARGKLGPVHLARLATRSAIDRFLAPK